MKQAQKNKIAPISVFFLLYISRIVVTLTNIQSVTTGLMTTDMLLSIVIGLGLTIVMSLPVVYCYRLHKDPFNIKWLGILYSLYFMFLAGINISRFSYFASTTLNPDSRAWVFVLIVTVCAVYGAILGIEGLSRFSAFAFMLFVAAVAAVILCNIQNFEEINLYPVINNKSSSIAKNAFEIASNTTEIAVFFCLFKRVNGYCVKQYIWAIVSAFFTLFILIYSILISMGDAAKLHPFPLFTLFQLARIGTLERMDILYISFWIFAIFIKASLLIYCACISFKPIKQKTKCLIAGAGTAGVALYASLTGTVITFSTEVMEILFLIFCVVIPLFVLIFKKRNRGDELIEKF